MNIIEAVDVWKPNGLSRNWVVSRPNLACRRCSR